MTVFTYVLFVLGLIAYVCALYFMWSNTGEILSDTGNALMLITAVVTLFQIRNNTKKS